MLLFQITGHLSKSIVVTMAVSVITAAAVIAAIILVLIIVSVNLSNYKCRVVQALCFGPQCISSSAPPSKLGKHSTQCRQRRNLTKMQMQIQIRPSRNRDKLTKVCNYLSIKDTVQVIVI